MLTVGLNVAVRARGISGSARVTGYIAEALVSLPDTRVLPLAPPSSRVPGRVGRALRDFTWDMHRAARSADLDLLVSPCNTGRAPSSTPHVLWMHDTMVLDHPHFFDPAYHSYARATFGHSARRATTVVTASHHSAERIRDRWRIADVQVISWPSSPPIVPTQRMGIPTTSDRIRPSVLMVGLTEPHKNHAVGVQAVAHLRRLTGADIRLQILGPPGRAECMLATTIADLDPDSCWVRRDLGPVSDDDLESAYRSSWLLLQPSLDEGFGLPLLEAAARRLPVVHSGAGAMNELLPHACAADHSPSGLAHSMLALLDSGAYQDAQLRGLQCLVGRDWPTFRARVDSLIRDALQ